ncbi:cobalamin biosynthesis protein [Mycolicibacterium komossense]|uniref:Cobalamin biosynthesis protein CobD n=1 Tax=Mycolicibacterium komossense TaxID=1779 RepID=A0ABT3C6B4_9MYCO|nr:cobalamin biosynthesis protein [Mycolicibacterium komossense]
MAPTRPKRGGRAAGVLIGFLADVAFADPRRGHPVAGFGTVAAQLERITYRDSRLAGAMHTATLLAALAVGAKTAERAAAHRGRVWSATAVAAATWAALGGTSLARTGVQMADLLDSDDISAARALLPSLCGRDPAMLDSDGLTRAALESIAENTSDAQVAPVLWAAVGGVPGVVVYRGINTLDAMIGHRSPRYAQFGWAAARIDDLANYVGARVAGALVVVCAPVVGGSAMGALRAWVHDAAKHPSPNAGVVEAAFAGALGVQLGGPTQYRHELQIRPTLGTGPAPGVADLRRAVALSQAVQLSAATVAVVVAAVGLSAAGRSGRRASARR